MKDSNPYRPVLIESEIDDAPQRPAGASGSDIRTRAETIDDCLFTALLGIVAPPVFNVISVFMLLNLPQPEQGEPRRQGRLFAAWVINSVVIAILTGLSLLLFLAL